MPKGANIGGGGASSLLLELAAESGGEAMKLLSPALPPDTVGRGTLGGVGGGTGSFHGVSEKFVGNAASISNNGDEMYPPMKLPASHGY